MDAVVDVPASDETRSAKGFSACVAWGPATSTACWDPAVVLRVALVEQPKGSVFDALADSAAKFIFVLAEGDRLGDSEYYVIVPYGTDQSATSATLPAIPFGPRRAVRVEVWNGDGIGPTFPIARGRTLPVDVESSTLMTDLTAYVTRIDTFTPPFDDASKGGMTAPHFGGSALALPDSKVVFGGGATPTSDASQFWDRKSLQDSAKVVDGYEPSLRQVTPLGELQVGRAFDASAVGDKGEVIFAGGLVMDGGSAKPTAHVEIYTPAKQKFDVSPGTSGNPRLGVARARHTCTQIFETESSFLCAGGKGDAASTWETWDSEQGSIGGDLLKTARWNHGAARVPASDDVFIILVGGENTTGTVSNFEVLHFRNDYTWEIAAIVPLPPVMGGALGRTLPGVVYDGQTSLYVIGGYSDKDKKLPLQRIDVYDLASDELDYDKKGRFTSENAPSFTLANARGAPMVAAAKLTYGPPRILVAGGIGKDGKATALAELIYGDVVDGATVMKVDTVKGTKFGTIGATLEKPRVGGVAVALLTGHVLSVGGGNVGGTTTGAPTAALLYNPR